MTGRSSAGGASGGRTSPRSPDRGPVELTGEVARKVWAETEPALRDRLSLLEIDLRTLILYCNAWQLLTECQQVLAEEGRYIQMETGYVARHPAAIDEAKAVSQIRQLAQELGMSPKSRRGVKVRSAEGDPLKDFLGGRPKP